MPWRCSVPGCRSNASSSDEYVPVFKFPSDDALRQEWTKRMFRSNWKPTSSSRVCELHFDPKFVSKIEEYVQNGQRKTFPRKRPLLSANAVPTIFPNLPPNLSSARKPVRENGCKRRKPKFIVEEYEIMIDDFDTNDEILNFDALKNGYQKYVNSPLWKFDISDTFVAYITDFPKIAVCIQINADLEVTVHKAGVRVGDLDWLLYNDRLALFSQFEDLLNYFAANL